MEIDGTVQNGVVVLESESSLPESTRVKVTATSAVRVLENPSGRVLWKWDAPARVKKVDAANSR